VVVRELVRLLSRIVVAVLIAIVLAEIKTIVSGGDTTHTFRITLLAIGAVMLLLGGTGTGSAASQVVNWGEITPGLGGVLFRGFQPKPEDPTLTAGAVFIASGVVLLALGAAL
jgi:hypothetical protein